jgi:hypothetical protein
VVLVTAIVVLVEHLLVSRGLVRELLRSIPIDIGRPREEGGVGERLHDLSLCKSTRLAFCSLALKKKVKKSATDES